MHPNLVERIQTRDRNQEGQSQAYEIYEPNMIRSTISGGPVCANKTKTYKVIEQISELGQLTPKP